MNLTVTYVTPCYHTLGLGYLLGLKCIVGASVVQVMTQTANHQCQYLCVRQDIQESSCLSKVKYISIFLLISLTESRVVQDRMGMGWDGMGLARLGQDRIGQDRIGSDRIESDRTGKSRMGQDRIEQNRIGLNRIGQDRMEQERTGETEGENV